MPKVFPNTSSHNPRDANAATRVYAGIAEIVVVYWIVVHDYQSCQKGEGIDLQIVDGYLSEARQFVSSNKDGRHDSEISLIVIHCISLPEGQYGNTFVQQLFCNTLDCSTHTEFRDLKDVRVSSHVFIRRDGSILQFVPFIDRAWHAGESSYGGRENCNDYSIGIELEGTDKTPFEEAQYDSLVNVCHLLCESYDICDIVGHSDIAPNRKTDPGSAFDWSRVTLNKEPSAGCHKEPSAGCHKEPSAGCHKEPSAGCHKEPSAGCHKEPSAGCHKEPSAGCQEEQG